MTGCAIKAEGFVGHPLEETSIILEAKVSHSQPTVYVHNTKFFGSHSHFVGGSVYVRNLDLILKNCSMTMTVDSKPPSIGGLIFYDTADPFSLLEVDNVVLNATLMKLQSIPLMTIF